MSIDLDQLAGLNYLTFGTYSEPFTYPGTVVELHCDLEARQTLATNRALCIHAMQALSRSKRDVSPDKVYATDPSIPIRPIYIAQQQRDAHTLSIPEGP